MQVLGLKCNAKWQCVWFLPPLRSCTLLQPGLSCVRYMWLSDEHCPTAEVLMAPSECKEAPHWRWSKPYFYSEHLSGADQPLPLSSCLSPRNLPTYFRLSSILSPSLSSTTCWLQPQPSLSVPLSLTPPWLSPQALSTYYSAPLPTTHHHIKTQKEIQSSMNTSMKWPFVRRW